ncbi:MAG: ADP-forming succinate--CoA ligase subunit beta [Candidatus Thermoplasmatota archaeon]|jgi:succinyl-CoA synthetase beta subunit|nr:ADP-forming succinate--CoA ligase subunit beta [Candidatus Thermoplasmatota archaeon]
MKLHEYRAKEIFSQFGIPVPKSIVIDNENEGEAIHKELEFPVALKAQVLVGGRGKAGGIRFAESMNEARRIIPELLGMELKGHAVRQLLIEEKADLIHARELYVGFTVNRKSRSFTCILSSRGGVDIEEVARENPGAIARFDIDPEVGFQQYHARKLSKQIGLAGKKMLKVAAITVKLYDVFRAYDGELAEINPLILTDDGNVIAVDAVLNIDNNALFRHPEFSSEGKTSEEFTDLEKEAREAGLAYVDLPGDIGIIGCGAGLVMASLDILKQFNGEPANFLDVGGGANARNMAKALSIVLKKPDVRSIFINIFGGITKCDEIARGIVDTAPGIPISVRMMGTNEEEGKKILTDNGYHVYENMEDSAKNAVEQAKAYREGL